MIWLLRHGDAKDQSADDASRALTSKGERQARAAGRALAVLDPELEVCLTSPKIRARDTARIACEELGLDVRETEELRGGDFDPVEIAEGADVLLVGHEPDFSRAIQAVTGARVELKKGGLAAIEGGALLTLLRPAQLRAIGSGRR